MPFMLIGRSPFPRPFGTLSIRALLPTDQRNGKLRPGPTGVTTKVGITMHAERKVIRRAEVSQPESRPHKRGSRAVTVCVRTLQSDKSTQLFDCFGGVLGFLGCQDDDLAGTLMQDAVMDCRA